MRFHTDFCEILVYQFADGSPSYSFELRESDIEFAKLMDGLEGA